MDASFPVIILGSLTSVELNFCKPPPGGAGFNVMSLTRLKQSENLSHIVLIINDHTSDSFKKITDFLVGDTFTSNASDLMNSLRNRKLGTMPVDDIDEDSNNLINCEFSTIRSLMMRIEEFLEPSVFDVMNSYEMRG